MKTLQVTYLRQQSVITAKQPPYTATQTILTDKKTLDIPCPAGFVIVSINEVLPEITIKDESIRN